VIPTFLEKFVQPCFTNNRRYELLQQQQQQQQQQRKTLMVLHTQWRR
jgi:hypothetical protein